MAITNKQQKFLRTLAHDRKPVIWLGQNGLTDNSLAEIETALNHHELIKIKLRVESREIRDRLIMEICNSTGAENVQKIGNIVAIYRQNKTQPGIILPSE